VAAIANLLALAVLNQFLSANSPKGCMQNSISRKTLIDFLIA